GPWGPGGPGGPLTCRQAVDPNNSGQQQHQAGAPLPAEGGEEDLVDLRALSCDVDEALGPHRLGGPPGPWRPRGPPRGWAPRGASGGKRA
ncbi:hypothetical protein ENH_00014790, partial [Eimeria necatrix]